MNKLEKEFIPYNLTLEIDKLGFSKSFEICDEQYIYRNSRLCRANEGAIRMFESLNDEIILAPLYQQCWRWFREKYQMIFCYEPCLKKNLTYIFFIYIEATGEKVFVVESKYDEEAELACLNKLIEICKNEQ
jgi:hypothetical protein